MAWNQVACEPLFNAVMSGDLHEFERLLRQYPDNVWSENGFDAWLHTAASEGHIDIVRLLVEKYGVNVNDVRFEDDHGAIVDAATGGHLEVVRWLLEHGAALHRDENGEPYSDSLIAAIVEVHLDIVKLLVEHGANIHSRWGCKNAVAFAEQQRDKTIANYLRSLGAKHITEIVPRVTSSGHKSLLSHARKHWGTVQAWEKELSHEPPVLLHLASASEKRQGQTLFTIGLCDIDLRSEFVELEFQLPSDWPLTEAALSDAKWNWPIKRLQNVVSRIISEGSFPNIPDPVFVDSDVSRPLVDGTKLCGWVAVQSETGQCLLKDCRNVKIFSLIPIYPEEADWLQADMDASIEFIGRLHEHGIPEYIDPERKNMVTEI